MSSRYWRRWFKRAWRAFRDCRSVAGTAATVVVAGAAAALGVAFGADDARDQALVGVVWFFLALGCMLFLVFAWHFFRAPGHLASDLLSEKEADIESLRASLRSAQEEAGR
jgi:hypothetical protein